jgi:hypothetical protein
MIRTGAASIFLPWPRPELHKNDAGPQQLCKEPAAGAGAARSGVGAERVVAPAPMAPSLTPNLMTKTERL